MCNLERTHYADDFVYIPNVEGVYVYTCIHPLGFGLVYGGDGKKNETIYLEGLSEPHSLTLSSQ